MTTQPDLPQRDTAYTTPRPDVFALVPAGANLILDIGCSNGALGASLRAARSGRSVVGVELDPLFASQAGARLDHVLCTDVNQMDWEALAPGIAFDCIIFADVLEHLNQPRHHLEQALRRLRAGGCIVLSLPNIRHLSAFWAIFVRGQFPQRERGIFDSTHLRWFTLADARRMSAAAGLRVDEASYALRFGDQGGGRWNRLLNRLPRGLQSWFPIRELLTYQFCLRLVAA
jgi:SAM-dependent methyltransferase